jgi:hypothetical protein
VQGVELEDLDAGVEVAGGFGTRGGAPFRGKRVCSCGSRGDGCGKGRSAGGCKVGFKAGLVYFLRAGVRKEEGCAVVGLLVSLFACLKSQDMRNQLNLQVDDNVGIDISFDTLIAILHNFFPDLSIPNFGDQRSELACSKRLFSFCRI